MMLRPALLAAVLSGLLALPVAAQASDAPARASDPAAQTADPAREVPPLLQQMGFSPQGRRFWNHGSVEIWGTLPDGTRIEVHYDTRGVGSVALKQRVGTLPPALIDRFVDGATANYPVLASIAALREIERDDTGEVALEGHGADGREIKVAFDAAGRLVEFDQDRGEK